MLTLVIILTVMVVVLLGLLMWKIFEVPPPCGRIHYEYLNSHDAYPSPVSTLHTLMLNEAHSATKKAEELAEERLRMLHRLNDIYLNRESNRD